MKKILLLALALMLCISLCSCDSLLKKVKTAVTGEEESVMPADYITTLENEQFSYELYEGYVKIIEYLGEESELTIPSEIDNKPVKVIGSLCFFDNETKITSVIIPESVTTIEASAFYYADNLVSVTIPDSVTSIGSRAFAWCNALESFTFGAGVTEIPEYCFNHCASLINVAIPADIKKIGLRAFSYCDKLNDQIIPATVESVGERAFAGCPALEFITFENASISLGKDIFAESNNVVILAAENSAAMNYCAEYNLRWSVSKDIEAIVLGSSEESPVDNSEVSE